ncbi:hypothetical protein GCM10010967_28930 [Dyadobacter beijingensis]|uniref:Uncharacterized protein n=1 Tax=Dyadobacter beijingensis TaxID=365489 RepID=A0ABQ2HWY9_9BACT|nr:hypothetical protein [Dyadobacter beijingensis]GGM93999.1 hypothetical protein GCM10010967_28930 [Dyadobacter beijingensis]
MVDPVPSPQNTYTVRFGAYEVRMSHWINEPGIYRVQNNQLLFDMPSTWSCDEAIWIDDSTVELKTRLYPGREYCDLRLNLATGTGTAERGFYPFANSTKRPPKHFEGTFYQIYQWL